jgi:hypothetical protein
MGDEYIEQCDLVCLRGEECRLLRYDTTFEERAAEKTIPTRDYREHGSHRLFIAECYEHERGIGGDITVEVER